MTDVFDMTTGVWSDPSHGQDERNAPIRDGVAALRLESVTDCPENRLRTVAPVLAVLDIAELLNRYS